MSTDTTPADLVRDLATTIATQHEGETWPDLLARAARLLGYMAVVVDADGALLDVLV